MPDSMDGRDTDGDSKKKKEKSRRPGSMDKLDMEWVATGTDPL